MPTVMCHTADTGRGFMSQYRLTLLIEYSVAIAYDQFCLPRLCPIVMKANDAGPFEGLTEAHDTLAMRSGNEVW